MIAGPLVGGIVLNNECSVASGTYGLSYNSRRQRSEGTTRRSSRPPRICFLRTARFCEVECPILAKEVAPLVPDGINNHFAVCYKATSSHDARSCR